MLASPSYTVYTIVYGVKSIHINLTYSADTGDDGTNKNFPGKGTPPPCSAYKLFILPKSGFLMLLITNSSPKHLAYNMWGSRGPVCLLAHFHISNLFQEKSI